MTICYFAIITWAPHHESNIRKVYAKKVEKHLRDMLTEARGKGARPHWIGEQAWDDLLKCWVNNKFKEKYTQNKNNQASTRGGALHTMGRKSQVEGVLGLVRKISRAVESDLVILTKVSLFVQATSHTHHHFTETEALRQEIQHATEHDDATTT
uniref:Transposase, Ptta/En/Spm, plant n=1 Tax=Cajanus cajan TaxID=3821 RepID=A0A151SR43_CAJCA|nr:hypothetical protein KK1_003522 [Cajanus cajan]